jgi:hypothetical protein
VGTVSASLAADAKAELCGTHGDASLSTLAKALDSFDPSHMDASNLDQLQVSGDQAILRDAAVTAVQSVQGSQVDKASASQAASAIRALETAVC